MTLAEAGGWIALTILSLSIGAVFKLFASIREELAAIRTHCTWLERVHKDPKSAFATVDLMDLQIKMLDILEERNRFDRWTAAVLRELMKHAEVSDIRALELENPDGNGG